MNRRAFIIAALCTPVANALAKRGVVTWDDGSPRSVIDIADLPAPATLPVVQPPVVTPTTLPNVVTPPADPNVIRVAAGDDLTAALAQMADGKTLQLAAGGKWPNVIGWRWSRATLTRFGDGPAPEIGGFKTTAPFSDTTIAGITARGTSGYGFDLRGNQLTRVTLADCTADGFQAGYTIHMPDLEKIPVAQWHQSIAFRRCRAMNCQTDNPVDQYKGQGWYVANVNGLLIEDCHADNCGDMAKPGIFNHGFYLAAMNRGAYVLRSIGTRCASYAIQSRSDGGIIEQCAAYDCGMGLMLNGPTGTARNNVVIRGHGHAGLQTYGKGGLDLHIGAGEITGNIVVNGPQKMPAGWYMPPAINIAYRETKHDATGKRTNAIWEWTKNDWSSVARPLAKAGAGNVDQTATVVSVDVPALLAMPPAQASSAARAMVRGAVR